MHDLEFNKIAAAVLVAGITAMVCGIIASGLVHPKMLAKNVYEVAGVEPAAPKGGEAAPAAGDKAEPIDQLMAAADPKAGEEVAKKCTTCHSFDKGGANKVGPNLYGVVGEDIGQGKGFSFSDALKSHKGKWDVATLNEWLWKPNAFAKGTKMTFAGLPKAQDRANIIAYLNTLK